jgi:predicted RNA-binding protein with RPS1 domain
MFFVKRVEEAVQNGNNVSAAVQALDARRDSLSLAQFHRQLQPKKTTAPHAATNVNAHAAQ